MSKDNEVQLGENCRLKGGRLECGYVNGPFTNPRRPPPWFNSEPDYDNNLDNGQAAQDKESSGEWLEENDKKKLKQPKGESPLANNKSKTSKKAKEASEPQKLAPRCVEIRDRIVCRDM